MKMRKISIFVTLVLLAAPAEARVGNEAQKEYENDAVIAGYCNNSEHLKWLEGIYNACVATGEQWESLYKTFEFGKKQPKLCGMNIDEIDTFFARRRSFKEFISDVGCE